MVHNDQSCSSDDKSKRRIFASGYSKRFQEFSCKAVIKAIKENYEESRKEWLLKQLETKEGYSLWRGDNKPIELWSNAVITQKLNYIHQNPVEEGLVFKAEDYMYSSAYDYTGENGMIDILVID